MDKIRIIGGQPLHGKVSISGAKNAAIAIIPAAVLVEGICRIENVPDISDVRLVTDILSSIGAKVKFIDKNTIQIDSRRLTTHAPPYALVQKMRASYYLIGSLLGRFRKAAVAMPGGCNFGTRPIDQHLKGFRTLGAETEVVHGVVEAHAEQLVGGNVYLDVVSVGATINIMLAAVLADGLTVIENVAKEPHIVDVANFLNSMGANVKGAGTDVIRVQGVDRLMGGTYSIIPDQIEAGTYMIAAAATGGDVVIENVIPKHLESISAKLMEMNVNVTEHDDSVRVWREEPLKCANVKTLPYPGFPTDLQPQIATLLCLAEGTSIVTEGVWDNRFQYVPELLRLGAQITVDGQCAIIEGIKSFGGCQVKAMDLRAGASMIIAGLAADGVTEIDNTIYIYRGYEDIVEKLTALGAQISRQVASTDVVEQVS